MTQAVLKIQKAGPYITVQDEGRPGYLRSGVSQGGAMDWLALEEGRLLVGNKPGLAALEILGIGGRFEAVGQPIAGALTGARVAAGIEGSGQIDPYTSFTLQPGQVLDIGSVKNGNYGYLSIAGGVDTDLVLGSRSTHVRARFGGFKGRCLKQGDRLPIAPSDEQNTCSRLPQRAEAFRDDIRIIWGAQSSLFGEEELQRFAQTKFEVTHEIDRMGARLRAAAVPIRSEQGLVAISGAIALGDIQVTGSGRPTVLLADRQPTGGYPRIGTIIAADIVSFVQRPAGATVRFVPVSEGEAIEALHKMRKQVERLPDQLEKSFGDPFASHRLLAQNLISGVVGSVHDKGNKDQRS